MATTGQQRFERYAGYKARTQAWRFFYASLRGGADYVTTLDALNNTVLPKFTKEKADKYAFRLNAATYDNYCRPIVQRYADAVFAEPIKRMDDQRFLDWAENVDRTGTNLQRYMRLSTGLMQALGVYWTAVDASQRDAEGGGKDDEKASKPYLRQLFPWSIVGMDHSDGILDWIVEHHEVWEQADAFTKPVASHLFRLWTPTEWAEYTAQTEDGEVTPGDFGTHNFKGREGEPIVPFFAHIYNETEPFHGDGQLIDIAEANKKIFNFASLLDVELFKNTISTLWVTGCSGVGFGDEGKDEDNIYFLEPEGADIKTVGAHVGQAESLRLSIQAKVREIRRAAGLTGGEATERNVAESGEAKARDLEPVYAGCKRIADSAEKTENDILVTVCQHIGVTFEPTDYPDSFNLATLDEEMSRSIDMVAMSITSRLAEAEQSKKVYQKMHPKAPNLKEMMAEVDAAAAEPAVEEDTDDGDEE